MSKHGASISLPELPKAFLNSAGQVDPALLQDIFRSEHRPAKNVRKLLRNSPRASRERVLSPYEELALVLPDTDFRCKWYRDRARDRDGSVRTLF